MKNIIILIMILFSAQAFSKCLQAIGPNCIDLGTIDSNNIKNQFERKSYAPTDIFGNPKKGKSKKGYFKKGNKPIQKNLVRLVSCQVWNGAKILDQLVMNPQFVNLDDEGLKREAARRAGIKASELTNEISSLYMCSKSPKK